MHVICCVQVMNFRNVHVQITQLVNNVYLMRQGCSYCEKFQGEKR